MSPYDKLAESWEGEGAGRAGGRHAATIENKAGLRIQNQLFPVMVEKATTSQITPR